MPSERLLETIAEANEQTDDYEAEEVAADAETAPPAPDAEPEAEPEAAAPVVTEADIERAFKSYGRAVERYQVAAVKLRGETGMPLDPCPLCASMPGLVLPFDPANPDDAEVKRETDAYFGGGAPALEAATFTETCSTCKGFGELRSGSKVPAQVNVTCRTCLGSGYVEKQSAPAPAPVFTISGATATSPGSTDAPVAMPDAWGRQQGHPHWGRDPREVGMFGTA